MLRFEFKTYIANGFERYGYVTRNPDGDSLTTKNVPFPDSLLALLYLDIDQLTPLFDQMDSTLAELHKTKNAAYADQLRALLGVLSTYHAYFEFLCLDWSCRLDRAQALGFEDAEHLLSRKEISDIPCNLQTIQAQVKDLFSHVLDIDDEKAPVPEKLTAYYKSAGDEAFQFHPQPMGFEMVYGRDFAEVLCPTSIYDLIDYHVRECVKREVKMRLCKNCKRWFAVTGHSGTEYCDRPFDEKGRTCKEIGAIAVWTKNKTTDEVFKVYRREYKKRFGWIKAGKLEQEAFYVWSEKAREKKAECDGGKITLEEFTEWLHRS